MELLNRFRNVTVLLLVIFAQLVLLAYQVRNDQDVRVIRVWAVTAVTPLARTLESIRGGVTGFAQTYFVLKDQREANRRMQAELDRLKMENQFLKTEMATSERARALSVFQTHTPSRTLATRVIGIGSGASSKMILVDRGSAAGVIKGMAVVTPDGIAGKVLNAYPTASQVLLVTDPEFAAGVVSQKNKVKGTLKGLGYGGSCRVDYIQNEEKVEAGEWFYTSGDDRVFPKGFPVGIAKVVRSGTTYKEIFVDPSGLQRGLEEVLILLEGVHQPIPDTQTAAAPIYLAPPPPEDPQAVAAQSVSSGLRTDADRLHEEYKAVGEAQGHKFGEGLPGSKPPDFTGLGGNPPTRRPQRPSLAPAPPPPVTDPPSAAAPKPQQ